MIRGRIVDLSHKLYPGKEEYPLELKTHFTDELYPQYQRDKDVWYVLQDIHMLSHCGTHIEFAAHLDQLRKERFTLFVLALSVVGLDSCPVRLVAVEEDE